MGIAAMATITSILADVRSGQPGATNRLFELVYDDLKNVARQKLRGKTPGVLQPTALINSAFQRLAEREGIAARDRRHFFYLLSRAMHDILVETVRAELAAKRGGGARRVTMVELTVDNETRQVELLDLHEALLELETQDPVGAQVITLRYYGGLTLDEIVESSGLSLATVRKNWAYAIAWLHERLSRSLRPREA